MKIVKNVAPPTGLSRLLFRIPIYVYRLGMGQLFGDRLMPLNHIGRVSGKQRATVLEVVTHHLADDSFVVASGWGPTAAWYRNVIHTPEVSIQVGRQTIPVTAVRIPEDERADIFANYAAQHRTAAKHLLPRLFAVDDSDADFRAVGKRMPFIRFIPPGRPRMPPPR